MSLDSYHSLINRDLPPLERGCHLKGVYVSRREARSSARHGRTQDGALHPYHCQFCGGWHLGHRR